MTEISIGPEEVTAAIGMRGTGKSTLAMKIAEAQPPEVTVVAWDPKGVWPAKYSYRPRSFDLEEFDAFMGYCIRAAPCRVFLEEIEQLLRNGIDLPPNTRRYTLMGREAGMSYHLDLRIPQKVTKDLLDEADHFFIFKTEGARRRYLIKRYIGKAHRSKVNEMDTWTKDPREGGGRFFYYRDGELTECDPLQI